MVQQRVKDLQSVKGLAPRTIETIYVVFASIMRGAVRDGYIRKTPCADIRLPEVGKTTVRLLTPAQVLALADVMPARYALLVLLGAGTGLRQGEAFGLALDRIDLDKDMITVDQQVIVVDRHPVLAPPKTSSSLRDVPMPRFVRRAVQAHADELGLAGDAVLCAAHLGEPCCVGTTTTGTSGSPPSRRPGSPRTPRSTICGTPSPARHWLRACRSRRLPLAGPSVHHHHG